MILKTAILDILLNSKDPLKIEEIRAALPKQISPRSIRRYLQELQQQDLVKFIGSYKGRCYLALQNDYTQPDSANSVAANPEHESSGEHAFFSIPSLSILQQLQIPLYKREPCGYNQEWLLNYIPNQTYYLSTKQRKQMLEVGRQNNELQPAGTYAHKIYERLLIDLSYNSSRLEGNTYSLADTRNLLLYGKSAANKLDSEKVMILNHKEAIRFLIENINKINITIETIGTLHYLLSDDLVLAEFCGRVRTEAVKVSASVYMPLDNARKLDESLHIIAQKAQQIIDPFEQSIFLLIHIAYLQAYIDVNKRLARLAANIPLIKNNLAPIAFNDIDVDDYRSAMIAIYEFNQPQPLTELYAWSYIRTAKEYKVAMDGLSIDEVRIKYRVQRRALLHDIVKNMIVKNIPEYIKNYALQQAIPAVDMEKFLHYCLMDLHNLDQTNSLGLGITQAELLQWRKKLEPHLPAR